MSTASKYSLVKPTVNTPFKIDFDWWKAHDQNWRIYLLSFLCDEHRAVYENVDPKAMIDLTDPQTAEVHPVDGLQHTLLTHCALQPDFINSRTTLVDAVFRVFLANENKALTPLELSAEIGRPAETILRTLSGPRVYQGIRPSPE